MLTAKEQLLKDLVYMNAAEMNDRCIRRINEFWRMDVARKGEYGSVTMAHRYGVPNALMLQRGYIHKAIVRARRYGKRWEIVT